MESIDRRLGASNVDACRPDHDDFHDAHFPPNAHYTRRAERIKAGTRRGSLKKKGRFGKILSVRLKQGNWALRNFDRLRRFAESRSRPALAVFDWDNTSIFGDIGDVYFREQVFRRDFRLTSREFEAVIPDEVNGVDSIVHAGGTIRLPELKGELVRAYRIFERDGSGPKMDSGDVPSADFAVCLLTLNQGLESTEGIGCRFAFQWITRFFRGFTPGEIGHASAAVFRRQLRLPIRTRSLRHSRLPLTVSWTDGMRRFPEMKNLMNVLKHRGFEIGVVTATNVHIASAAVRESGYPVDRLVGQACEITAGRLSGFPAPGFRVNYGAGKTENILRSFGREPELAAGDSDGDYEMLTEFPGTELRLIIRRGTDVRIRALLERTDEEGYLRQDVDPRSGKFIGMGAD